MNDDSTLERAARSFIEVGPTRAPERAVEAALLRIDSTSQERGPWIPWRFPAMPLPARLAALAVVGGLVLIGLAMMGGVGGRAPASTSAPSQAVVAAAPSSAASASAVATSSRPPTDYSYLPGRILVEHLGNAMDLSEAPASDYHPNTRRLYFMDPTDMSPKTVVEFLPGQPRTGKSAADISADGKKVVFQDWVPDGGPTHLFEANLDGTGFHQIPILGTFSLSYPDYDPTGTRIVYLRVEGSQSWLEIADLASGQTTKLDATVGPRDNALPEQPAWSPDGSTIAFTRVTWPDGEDPIVSSVHYGDVAPLSGTLSLLDVASGKVTDVDLSARPDLGASTVFVPGDVNWSPDSRTIIFAAGPFSTMGSVGTDKLVSGSYAIGRDGSDLTKLADAQAPQYLPDGQHILVQNNVFSVMNPDGTDLRPVKDTGMDVSDMNQGFAYVGHWINP